MPSRSRLVTVSFASLLGASLCLSLSARGALAHPGITGYSGKPYNGTSETCTTNCHAAGGTKPTLTVNAPSTVQVGSTSSVTIIVSGTRARTSMNAAFSDGVKTFKGTNTDTPLPAQEPTEVGAVVPAPSGASATYVFSFVAPKVNGPVTMWVAGMSSNGSGTNGDGVANTTRTIMVTGAGVPDAGSSGSSGSSGGADAGGDAASSGSSGGTPPADSGAAGTGASGSSSGHATSGSDDGDSGCSVTSRAKEPMPLAPLALALAMSTALVVLRRKRSAPRP